MSEQDIERTSASRLRTISRRAVNASAESLVRMQPPQSGASLPLMIQPAVKGVDLIAWTRSHRALVETQLHQHGALLFRGFDIHAVSRFEEFSQVICADLLEYKERSSPRHSVQGNIYTSTDYPAQHSIFLHNENSYQQRWPMKLFFFCAEASEQGGETPIADSRKIFQRLDPQVVNRFREKQWMYVRNFGDGFGLSWQSVFGTNDKQQVEAHCRKVGIEVEWKEGNRLRTRAVRPAIARHPRTSEMVWFNHATFFHISTLEQSVRDSLLREFSEEDLPTNTFYGDGTPIENDVLEHLREAYRQETVALPWQQGDIMLLDNMLAAHGRAPYSGTRRILVGMGEPMSWTEL